jgi:hypothetical protein
MEIASISKGVLFSLFFGAIVIFPGIVAELLVISLHEIWKRLHGNNSINH